MNTTDTRGEQNGIPYILRNNTKIFLYELRKDGNNMDWKIANPLHPDNCEEFGIKEVEIIERKKRHDPEIRFSRVDDPITGIIYGVPTGIDQATKQLIFKPITLKVHQEYDMARESDRQIWMVAQRHACMLGNPYPSSHKPYYKVVDREQEAKLKIIKTNTRTRALDIISEMKDGELADMATNLGIVSPYTSQVTLQAELMSKAEQDPQKFCEIYDNQNRVIVTVLNRCRAVGLVRTDPNQGLLWKETTPLGLTEAAAIRYVSEHAALLQNMDFESKQKNENFRKFATAKEKETAIENAEKEGPRTYKQSEFLTSESLVEQAKGVAQSMDRVLEKERALDEKLAKLDLILAANTKSEITEEKSKEKTLEDYQMKAAELGYPDANSVTDKKVLSDWIVKKIQEKKDKKK